MKLDDWLNLPNPDGSKKSRGDFARRIGVTAQMISCYVRDDDRRMYPGRDILSRIYVETNGAVTANDFFDMAPTQQSDPQSENAA